MSKADQLGTGRSFGQVGRGRSARGRAKAVAQGDLPTYELVRLPLDEVSPTPLNPRRNFGTEEELTRFGEELRQAQLAACVVVTRDSYLTLWPDHDDRIGSAKHVLINGERRYRSACHVGLEALDFVVRDDLASSREEFINHLLKENLEREDFDVIERARGVEQFVQVCAEESERGARSRAAEKLNKDRSWVTNQLVLLELPEELQAMLSVSSLAERDGRLLARHLKENPGLGAAALLEHLDRSKASAAAAKELDRAALEAARKAASGNNGGMLSADNKVLQPGPDDSDEGTPPSLLSADNKPAEHSPEPEKSDAKPEVPNRPSSPKASSALPKPRHNPANGTPEPSAQGNGEHPHQQTPPDGAEGRQGPPKLFPYDTPFDVAVLLERKMSTDGFFDLVRLVNEKAHALDPERLRRVLADVSLSDSAGHTS